MIGPLLDDGGIPGVINGALPNGSQDSSASFTIVDDGSTIISGSAADWVTPASATVAAFYQVKVDVTSGAFGAGSDSTGTWIDCSDSPAWNCSFPSAPTATFTISFREKASQLMRSTQAGVTLTATDPG